MLRATPTLFEQKQVEYAMSPIFFNAQEAGFFPRLIQLTSGIMS